MKIWANTIVNNEDQFIWYSIMSVVDYVDKVLIFDTGSTDKTVEIVKEMIKLKPGKIIFQEVGEVDKYEFTNMRQKMLEQSDCDWIMVLDGDEIWWKKSIQEVTNIIKKRGHEIDGVVVPFYTMIGDIYHYQEEEAGQYMLLGRRGHYNLRFFNKKIPGLHVGLPYGKEGYYDLDNKVIQERKDIIFIDAPYMHCTHLQRSSKKRQYIKYKYELGRRIGNDFKLPEVLYSDQDRLGVHPLAKRSTGYLIRALIENIPRKIKRMMTNAS